MEIQTKTKTFASFPCLFAKFILFKYMECYTIIAFVFQQIIVFIYNKYHIANPMDLILFLVRANLKLQFVFSSKNTGKPMKWIICLLAVYLLAT